MTKPTKNPGYYYFTKDIEEKHAHMCDLAFKLHSLECQLEESEMENVKLRQRLSFLWAHRTNCPEECHQGYELEDCTGCVMFSGLDTTPQTKRGEE